MSAELRKHPRTPVNSRAAVIRIPKILPIMCTVVDLSKGGAGLTVMTTNGIPDTFILEIKGEPKIRSCRVAWRKEPNRIGVEFVSDEPASTVA